MAVKSEKSEAPEPATAPVRPAWLRQIREARRAATSLIGLTTLDTFAAIQRICEVLCIGGDVDAPLLEWDITRGATGRNRQGEAALTSILPAGVDALTATGALPEFLALLPKLPNRSIVFLHNIQLYLDNPGVQQGLLNLRDVWLPKKCMAVLLGPEIALPPTLVNDVLLFEEPAPDDSTIAAIATSRLVTPDAPADPTSVQNCTAALRGVGSAFLVDQILAMSTRKGVVRMADLWEKKRQTINAIKGLSVWSGEAMDLAGQDVLQLFLQQAIRNSPTGPPAALVFLDEAEKLFGGAGTGPGGAGDSSGVSQYQFGLMLKMMEDWGSLASLLMGVGGVGKTAIIRWLAQQMNIMLIDMDPGAMKGSYVGQSEAQSNQVVRTLKAISGGRPGALWFFFVCNRLDIFPQEFKRRMNMGMWFCDLPRGRAGRDPIWAIHKQKYGIDLNAPIPTDNGWTGAEIRNCCQIAWRLGIPLAEAAQFIVPLVASEGGPDGAIERLHRLADQRFLSVDHAGKYDHRSACPNAPNSTAAALAEPLETRGGRAIDEDDR